MPNERSYCARPKRVNVDQIWFENEASRCLKLRVRSPIECQIQAVYPPPMCRGNLPSKNDPLCHWFVLYFGVSKNKDSARRRPTSSPVPIREVGSLSSW